MLSGRYRKKCSPHCKLEAGALQFYLRSEGKKKMLINKSKITWSNY